MQININKDFVLGVWFITTRRTEVILMAYRKNFDWHLHVFRPYTGFTKDINLKAYPTSTEVKREGDDMMSHLAHQCDGTVTFKQIASPDPQQLYRTLRKIPGMSVRIAKGYLQ